MANPQNNQGGGQNEARSILEIQQSFAETLGYGNEPTWDLLSADHSEVLKQKLNHIIRDPEVPVDVSAEEKRKLLKRRVANRKIREVMFNGIWEQRKYTNRQSVTSIIFVLVAIDETDSEIAVNSRFNWSCHPVFRARRCTSDNSNSSSDCCMIFVDENGRVYQNWGAYLANNELPAGIMVAPRCGIYNLIDDEVQLETRLTPAASPRRRTVDTLDKLTLFGGLLASSAPIAAMLTLPVAAPVMAVAGAMGLGVAGYTTARSGAQLVNRSFHEQSISVADRSARNHWIGVVGGTVGLVATFATRALSAATNVGRKVDTFTEHTVNGLNISCIVISGAGVANGAIDIFLKFQDDDDISTMDVLQLSASLAIFTNSVYNFQLASAIIAESSTSSNITYRETLRNRQRSTFRQLSKRASRNGADIIRNGNDIPSPRELNDHFNASRFSVSNLGRNCGGLISGLLINVATKYGRSIMDSVIDGESFQNVISCLLDRLPEDVREYILNMTRIFMECLRNEVERFVQLYISTESVLYRIATYVMDNCSGYCVMQLDAMFSEILDAVREYYWSLNPNSFSGQRQKCQVCSGYYTICDL